MATDSATGPELSRAATHSWWQVANLAAKGHAEHWHWYEICGDVVETLRSLSALAARFDVQINDYNLDRLTCDDGADPAARVAEVAGHLQVLHAQLGAAERTADVLFHTLEHLNAQS
jgi:hypothetical protein